MQSTDKLKKLGWYPNFDLEKGFKRTIDSFEEESNTNEENKHCSSDI